MAGRARACWPRAAVLSLGLLALPAHGSPEDQGSGGGKVQKIGNPCTTLEDCNQIENGICNSTVGSCQCPRDHPIPNVISCLTASSVNQSCSITAQCRPEASNADCVMGVCTCHANHYKFTYTDGLTTCIPSSEQSNKERELPVDPTMIGILASLVLMFIIICVVLRLFSKARFRQNRTILNSANPRLMNTSFFKAPLIKSPVDQIRSTMRDSHSSRGSRSGSVSSQPGGDKEAEGGENGTAPATSPDRDPETGERPVPSSRPPTAKGAAPV